MNIQRAVRLGVLFGLAGGALGIAAACGDSGPSDSEYTRVKQELQDQQTANQQLQQQLADAKKVAAPASSPVATAAPAQASPAAATGIIPLIDAKAVTPAPPAPTPTALPAGATPPPRATPPASYYQPVGQFYVYAETLATTTASKFNIASTISCTPSGAFARGQRIVFRYEIVDMATGKRVTDQDGATIKVVLPNGDESVGRWSQRGGGQVPDAPFMFSSSWDIPMDYPLGAVDYKIVVATRDGRTFTWKPPYLTSVPLKEDTRPKVVQ